MRERESLKARDIEGEKMITGRQTETDRQRQRERQRQIHRNMKRDRKKERETETEREKDRQRHTHRVCVHTFVHWCWSVNSVQQPTRSITPTAGRPVCLAPAPIDRKQFIFHSRSLWHPSPLRFISSPSSIHLQSVSDILRSDQWALSV